MKNWLGLEKWFDFSHKHSFSGKVNNFTRVFMFDLLWTTAVIGVLLFMVGLNKTQLVNTLTTFWGPNALYAGLLNWGTGQIFMGKFMLFFVACILAPLWEEVAFRVVPILWAEIHSLKQKDIVLPGNSVAGGKSGFLFWTCCLSSIIFGLGHGSIINLLFQGVSGLTFSWLYHKNNDSYWSVFAAHSLWNFMIIFGLPLLMS